jgi:potassium channel subfamily K
MVHGEERQPTFQNLVSDVKAGNEQRMRLDLDPLPTSFAARTDFKKERALKRKMLRDAKNDFKRGSKLKKHRTSMSGGNVHSASLQRVEGSPLVKLAIILLYFAVGVSFYVTVEGWHVMDTIYYIIVTVTTVGYGDFAPETDEGKIFTIFYMLFGLGYIGSVIGEAIQNVMDASEAAALARLDDDPDDGEAPHLQKILMSFAQFCLCLVVGMVFFALSEGEFGDQVCGADLKDAAGNSCWKANPWVDGLYWSLITVTTVGYGDFSLLQRRSRIFSIFYILFCTVVLANAIQNVVEVMSEKKKEREWNSLKNQELDTEMILAIDKSGDEKIDKGEFLMYCLVKLGKVEEEECHPWMEKFDELDADGSGYLDADDLEAMKDQAPETQKPKQEQYVTSI